MKPHLKSDVNMERTTEDLTFYTKSELGKLSGIIMTYVDDTFETGAENFE